MSKAWGPYETDTSARVDSEALHTDQDKLQRVLDACREAGVEELGSLDRRVLSWLARWEPETVQVVAGIISRAGKTSPRSSRDLAAAVVRGEERLLLPSEAAAMVRVDEKTLTRWAQAGLIGYVWTGGRHRRYPESAVRAMLAGEGDGRWSE